MDFKERRRYVRWEIDKPARVRLDGAQASIASHVSDISLHGAQVSFAPRLKVDSFIKMTIDLADENYFEVEAWVVWHRAIDQHNIYGLYFTKIKEEVQSKIYNYVRLRAPNEITKGIHGIMQEQKGGDMPEDRRIFERFPASLPVNFINLQTSKEGFATSEDISAKGLGVVSDQEIEPRTSLELWVRIPDKGDPMYARGEVMWSKKGSDMRYRAGIRLEKANLMGLSRALGAKNQK